MPLLFIKHVVYHSDPETKELKILQPGAVHLVAADHVSHLTKAGAVREPTDEEVLIYRATHPEKTLDPALAAAADLKPTSTDAPAAPAAPGTPAEHDDIV